MAFVEFKKTHLVHPEQGHEPSERVSQRATSENEGYVVVAMLKGRG